MSEKLFDAFAAGCVPIYWGDTSLRCGVKSRNIAQSARDSKYEIDTRIPNIASHLIEYKINPKAFINAHNFSNLDELLDEVKRIDCDKNAYNEMINEPIFLGDFNPKEYYEKRLFNFLDSIFSQDFESAFRRGESNYLNEYTNTRKFLTGVHPQLIPHFAKLDKLAEIAYQPLKMLRKLREKFRVRK